MSERVRLCRLLRVRGRRRNGGRRRNVEILASQLLERVRAEMKKYWRESMSESWRETRDTRHETDMRVREKSGIVDVLTLAH